MEIALIVIVVVIVIILIVASQSGESAAQQNEIPPSGSNSIVNANQPHRVTLPYQPITPGIIESIPGIVSSMGTIINLPFRMLEQIHPPAPENGVRNEPQKPVEQITIRQPIQNQQEQERQEELVEKYKEGTITSREAAELARNPPVRPNQTIGYEINRYGPDFKPQATELVRKYVEGQIDYHTFITELNKVRTAALRAGQYRV